MSNVTKRMIGSSLVAAMAVLLGAVATARADAIRVYASGHCDLCADYEDGVLSLHYHFHEDSVGKDEDGKDLVGEIDPSALYTRVADKTKTTVPSSSNYSFLGAAAGSDLWVLSQNNVSGTPYLGFGTEELEDDDFPSGVTYKLLSASGPGEFSMWMSDMFGNSLVYWTTANGIDSTDVYTQAADSHSHANWGFTAEGVYTIQMQVTGTLTDGTTASSEIETFTFLVGSNTVVPEPCEFALAAAACGMVGLAAWRKRRSRNA